MLMTVLLLQLTVVSQSLSTEGTSQSVMTKLFQKVVSVAVDMKGVKLAVQEMKTSNGLNQKISDIHSDLRELITKVNAIEKVANCRAPNWVTPAGELGTVEEKQPFAATIVATDPMGEVTYSLQSGDLPADIELNTATGDIEGTAPALSPTMTGTVTYTFTIRATGSKCSYADRNFAILVTDIPYVPGQQNFTPSGTSSQTFTVPPGVPSISYPLVITAWGAGGGRGEDGPEGGGGGFTNMSLTSGLSSGDTLVIMVGHRGRNGENTRCAGGGGGSTSIRRGSDSVALVTAGGGGGGSAHPQGIGATGGGGGGQTGQQGLEDGCTGNQGGFGGTQSAPGTGGDSARGYTRGQNGDGRNGGDGGSRSGLGGGGNGGWGDGNGGTGGCVLADGGGGGGGGGHFGGGGGGAGCWGSGGGGGSGYYDSSLGTGTTVTGRDQSNYGQAQNDGHVVISW